MEFPSLPTDSLYKWLAIAGAVGLSFCIYTNYDAGRQKETLAAEFLAEYMDINDPKFSPYMDGVTDQTKLMPPWVYPPEATLKQIPAGLDFVLLPKKDRKQFLDAMLGNVELARSIALNPFSIEVMHGYFSRPTTKQAYTEALGFSEADFAKEAKEMTAIKFEKMTRDGRAFYMRESHGIFKKFVMARSAFQRVDQLDEAMWYSWLGILAFPVVVAAGFWGWWHYVQRHQNVILRAQALDAGKLLAKEAPKPPPQADRRKRR